MPFIKNLYKPIDFSGFMPRVLAGSELEEAVRWMGMAVQESARSPCELDKRGVIIVKGGELIGKGVNAPPPGFRCEAAYCQPTCRTYAVHAEMNAVIAAGRKNCIGGTIYISGMDMKKGQMISSTPCLLCGRVLTNAGIVNVVGSK